MPNSTCRKARRTNLPVKNMQPALLREGRTNDRFRIDRRITRHATRCKRHALESDGRASTSPTGKRRAFDDEVRPVRRGRCAFLITFPGATHPSWALKALCLEASRLQTNDSEPVAMFELGDAV